MTATGHRRTPRLPPPASWPPPAVFPTGRRPHRDHFVAAVVSMSLGCLAVVGALLPAFAGQRVGDPDTAVFWIGLAGGGLCGPAAIGLAIVVLARSRLDRWTTTSVAVVGVVLGGVALLLTASLAFSG